MLFNDAGSQKGHSVSHTKFHSGATTHHQIKLNIRPNVTKKVSLMIADSHFQSSPGVWVVIGETYLLGHFQGYNVDKIK